MTFNNCFYYLGEVILPDEPQMDVFSAVENFKPTRSGPVISVNGNFCKWFTRGVGKVEKIQDPEISLPIHVYATKSPARWTHRTLDLIGGLDSVELSLYNVWRVVDFYRQQPKEKHLVSLKGYEACFITRDTKGILRRLIVGFSDCGRFNIGARELFDETTRPMAGTRFFSALEIK